MYCEKCGMKIESEGGFCPNCGYKLGSHDNTAQQGSVNTVSSMTDWSKTQPTKALVVEIFAALCFVAPAIDPGSEIGNFVVILFGAALLAISYFLLRATKKKSGLIGLGYVGYVIACVGMVVIIFLLAIAVLTLSISLILNAF